MATVLLTNMSNRNFNGTFKRTLHHFSLQNFNDGWIDSDGRFRVYFPEHPRASEDGYVLREIVAYEAYNNTIIPRGMDVHHVDGNRLNDDKQNLTLLSHAEHSKLSNASRVLNISRECKNCGKEFSIKPWRLRELGHTGNFCSKRCYLQYRRGKNHPRYRRISSVCEYCRKTFEHVPYRKLRFCSKRCAAKFNWNRRKGASNSALQ